MSDMLNRINVDMRVRELQSVAKCNEYSARYGLRLSIDEAEKLLAERHRELDRNERVEWDGGILEKLIYAFADSVHLSGADYADTLSALQAMFYEFKNESLDLCDDDELIAAMRHAYDVSEGSLDYVAETAMSEKCRSVRFSGYEDEDEEIERDRGEGEDLL